MNRRISIAITVLGVTSLFSSAAERDPDNKPSPDSPTGGAASEREAKADKEAASRRQRMVDVQLRARDITDKAVLAAMSKVPRHLFVPEASRQHAYADRPLPIGHRQTISQPYIVALMTQLVGASKGKRALDVGTGSGYQAAVLAELVDQVYSMEIVEPLAIGARATLRSLNYTNVEVRHGDGYRGWPEHAPFDLIIVAAAPDHVPQPLIDQLAAGGKLVLPVGPHWRQHLVVIEKRADGTTVERRLVPVAFVPMTGAARDKAGHR